MSMTAAVDEQPQDPVTERPPEGPGIRLRTAREAAGMDLERVAAQLHLRPQQVEALEKDDYDGFAARVFVRGYLRNYARLVDLAVDEVLKAFDATCPDPDQPMELRRVGTHKPQVGSGHGVVRMVSWGLVLGIAALFLVWWAGYLELNGKGGVDVSSETADSAPPPGQLLQPVGGPAPEAVAPAETPAADAEAVEPAAPPAEPQPQAAAAATEAASAAAPQEPAAGAAAEPESTSEPAPAPPALGPQVVLSLTGQCWVEIRDQSGTYKLIGNFGPGTREVLGGEPPYRVLLGNAAAAELTVDGQPVDLVAHTRGQVARFTLDPSAQ